MAFLKTERVEGRNRHRKSLTTLPSYVMKYDDEFAT